MPDIKLQDLKSGSHEKMKLLVKHVESKLKKNGEEYSYCILTDGTSEIGASAWVPPASFPEKGSVIDVTIDVRDAGTAGKVYYNLSDWQIDPSANKMDFIRSAPVKPEEIMGHIKDMVNAMDSIPLIRKIAQTLISENEEKLQLWTAAKTIHHNYLSGLIYHMWRMLQAAKSIIDTYELNADLLNAAIILHDIGKIDELSMDEYGNSDYTVSGTLFGHLGIAVMMVERTCAKLGIDPTAEEISLLEHMLVSHHGKPELGALKMPAFAEAYALHMLDMLDSRMWQYEDVTALLDAGSCSGHNFGLDGAIVYRPYLSGAGRGGTPEPEKTEETGKEDTGLLLADLNLDELFV